MNQWDKCQKFRENELLEKMKKIVDQQRQNTEWSNFWREPWDFDGKNEVSDIFYDFNDSF